MKTSNIDEWSADFEFIIFSSQIFPSLAALFDRQRPALASSDTDEYGFVQMPSNVCCCTPSRQSMQVLADQAIIFGGV